MVIRDKFIRKLFFYVKFRYSSVRWHFFSLFPSGFGHRDIMTTRSITEPVF